MDRKRSDDGYLPADAAPARACTASNFERRSIGRWNDTRTQFPEDACVHQLFERQAARTPDAVALTFGEKNPTVAGLALIVAQRQAERVAPAELERLLSELEAPMGETGPK